MNEDLLGQNEWERQVAEACAQAGIALDKAQIASAGRALRRLQPAFPSGESLPLCTQSFADVLEGLGS